MNLFSEPWVLGGAVASWLIFGGIAAVHAIMYTRDARSVITWVHFCLAVLVIGAGFYWALGINRVQHRALTRLG